MLEKFSNIFSKKAVENAKAVIVEDVKKNYVGYIMTGIIGIAIATGTVLVAKAIFESLTVATSATAVTPSVTAPLISITENYYITVSSTT